MKGNMEKIINQIQDNGFLLDDMQATLGFDGFIDCIARIVKNRKDQHCFTTFNEMDEFGNYIISKKGKSCTLELNEQIVKIGGNMPILSMALGTLGVNVNCIGAMGYPDINTEFKPMSDYNCSLHTIANPGYTTALEFHDGKVMLARMGSIMDITWDSIKSKVGLDKLTDLLINSDIIGMVNWSEVENSSSIWEGIIEDIFPLHTPNKEQIVYFDLADCSKRHKPDIRHAINIVKEYSKHFKVILGMNENECKVVYEALYPNSIYDDFTRAGDMIYGKAGIDVLVVHPRDCAMAWDIEGRYRAENFYVDIPKISTGGGDNFNAGLSIAQLMGLDMLSSLVVANAVAAFYVKYGYSPERGQLVDFLVEWNTQIV